MLDSGILARVPNQSPESDCRRVGLSRQLGLECRDLCPPPRSVRLTEEFLDHDLTRYQRTLRDLRFGHWNGNQAVCDLDQIARFWRLFRLQFWDRNLPGIRGNRRGRRRRLAALRWRRIMNGGQPGGGLDLRRWRHGLRSFCG